MILTPSNCSVKMSRYGERDNEPTRTTTGHHPHPSGERGIDGSGSSGTVAALGATGETIAGGVSARGSGRARAWQSGQAARAHDPGGGPAASDGLGDGELCRLQS